MPPVRISDDAMDTPTPLGEEARRLKDAGLSWTEIGRRLGKSRQAVQQAAYPRARRLAQRKYDQKFVSRPGR